MSPSSPHSLTSDSAPGNEPRRAKHVVIGAGATGRATAKLLAQRGAYVVMVSRSGGANDLAGVTSIACDASDPGQLEQVSAGAHAIYNCANPAYHRWASDWPPLASSILQVAERTGAVLVTLSNLYGYGSTTALMRPSDPLDTTTKKGRIRAQMWFDALAAYEAGRVRVTEARASDFIGPGLGGNGHMGDRVVPRLLAGKSISVLGRTDVAHSWTAVDDVARTLVALGANERAWGRAWHVPTTAPVSQQDLIDEMAAIAHVPTVKARTIPVWSLRLVGLAVPAARELVEINYQFTEPFVMDSAETTDCFALHPTPRDETLRVTLESYGWSASDAATPSERPLARR